VPAADAGDSPAPTVPGLHLRIRDRLKAKNTFDVLYREGQERPKMMTASLHSRIVGRPGRIRALERFLDYVLGHDRVWIPTREQIARHWMATHPYRPQEES